MRIVVDINHPHDVHLFKNFIWEMKKRGHETLLVASNKDITYELLNNYKLEYIAIGSYGKSIFEKIINLPLLDFKMYNAVKNFNPDIFIGLGSIRAAHVSKIMRKPCILLTDTEHSREQYLLYAPFVDTVLTPSCFMRNLGSKQVRYEGYQELAYLHPKYFTPNSDILKEINLNKEDKFIVVRFVAWNASHDIGQYGIEDKVGFITGLEKYGKVLITSENKLSTELESHQITVSSEEIHSLLYYSSLYVGEGATMATESAILGTPSIYMSSLVGSMGNFVELEEKYDLVHSFNNSQMAFSRALEILQDPNSKKMWKIKRDRLLREKIDVTDFLIKFVERY